MYIYTGLNSGPDSFCSVEQIQVFYYTQKWVMWVIGELIDSEVVPAASLVIY